MGQTTIWKPSTVNSWKGGIAFLADSAGPRTPPTVTTPDGRTITGKYVNTNEGRHQWVFPSELAQMSGLKINYGGQTGVIESGATSYEGGGVGNWQPRAKGSLGAGGAGGGDLGGFGGGFGVQGVGQFGFAPQFIGDQFPSPTLTNFEPIPGADYQYVDPLEFGKYFNASKRKELGESFDQGGDFAMKAIDTELKALTSFVPKSAALKRQQIGQDNAFNQAQRTAQVNAAVPDVVKDLNRVAADARTYASGEVPNSVIDRGLEIGIRSGAADVAATSGFGIGSSAARKVSDLMSARERIGLSQYGLATLSANAADRTNLLLAPTQYSDAGGQVRVTPTLSGSQLQTGSFSEINSSIGIRGSEAFQGNIQQSQFMSQLQQRTQEFNSQSTLQNDQFNATNENNFALSYFNYLNSYVNSLAGAAQTNANTSFEVGQQAEAADTAAGAREDAHDAKEDAQDKEDTGNIVQDVIHIGGSIFGVSISDLRLKENIEGYSSGLEVLKKLRVVKYNYKDKTIAADGKKPHIGLIAQELQRLMPQSVGKHQSGYFQIDATELIYILIAAVQELANG